jgi:small subunit ribosomal protein S2
MSVPQFSLRQLINAGVHFGHTTRRWNPRMKPYLFGVRNGVHIIDLEQTVPLFDQALHAVRDVAAKGGRVLFVGTKRQASEKVAETARSCGQYFVNHRWLGGMLTNWKTISLSIQSLRNLEKHLEEQHRNLTKKERLTLERQREKLESILGGIKDMGGVPDILVVIDVTKEDIAIQEARRLGIPVVGILDSNANPEGITYPVPGNDDAKRAIDLYCDLFAAAVLDGLQEEMQARGVDMGAMENPTEEAIGEDAAAAAPRGKARKKAATA